MSSFKIPWVKWFYFTEYFISEETRHNSEIHCATRYVIFVINIIRIWHRAPAAVTPWFGVGSRVVRPVVSDGLKHKRGVDHVVRFAEGFRVWSVLFVASQAEDHQHAPRAVVG
eukprot:1587754-Lingulodinium_polyedra.AAC.1